MGLSDLDTLMAAQVMEVRSETLEQAWEATPLVESFAIPAGQVLLLVTLRARAGTEERLGTAAQEFVKASSRLPGWRGSSLHRSGADPQTWFLLERFANEESFTAHMASDYFRRFQMAQDALLSEPVRALFLQR